MSGVKNVKSVFSCKAECKKTIKCVAFTFIPKTELCILRSAAHEPCEYECTMKVINLVNQ